MLVGERGGGGVYPKLTKLHDSYKFHVKSGFHRFVQKLHGFIHNYVTIIVWILLKCNSYIFYIKTSQVE
jgi:hypothetical protein